MVKSVNAEMTDNRDKLRSKIQKQLEKYGKHIKDDEGMFGKTLTLIMSKDPTNHRWYKKQSQNDFLFVLMELSQISKRMSSLSLSVKVLNFDSIL